jgi:hypothetical protein
MIYLIVIKLFFSSGGPIKGQKSLVQSVARKSVSDKNDCAISAAVSLLSFKYINIK